MTMGKPHHNHFLTEDNRLIAKLEFQDGQMGFVGISGMLWAIDPNGMCHGARFINETASPPHREGQLDQQDLVTLANILSDQNFADLPAEIPSEQTLNPHRLTIRLGDKSSTLVLQTGQTIEDAVTALRNRHETPRSRFLTISQMIDRLVRQHCGDD